jgi:hypothetical protein
MSRNTQTREGYEFWDRLNAIPHYGFLLNQQGNGVVRAEGIGDWIERHPAQVVVDEAQTEVNVLREDNAKLLAEVAALSKNVVEFTPEDFDATLNNLRRMGAIIDGANAYKRDLCDSIIGALKFGYDDRCPPPPGHWAQTFWEIGRENGAAQLELASLRAEVEALRADKARLDSGMIMTWDRDQFGETHQTERRGMSLRAAIDEAISRSQPLKPA